MPFPGEAPTQDAAALVVPAESAAAPGAAAPPAPSVPLTELHALPFERARRVGAAASGLHERHRLPRVPRGGRYETAANSANAARHEATAADVTEGAERWLAPEARGVWVLRPAMTLTQAWVQRACSRRAPVRPLACGTRDAGATRRLRRRATRSPPSPPAHARSWFSDILPIGEDCAGSPQREAPRPATGDGATAGIAHAGGRNRVITGAPTAWRLPR